MATTIHFKTSDWATCSEQMFNSSCSGNTDFSQFSGHAEVSLFVCFASTVLQVHVDTDLVSLGAGQTARQWPTVAGQSGGERRPAVCQNGLQVTG